MKARILEKLTFSVILSLIALSIPPSAQASNEYSVLVTAPRIMEDQELSPGTVSVIRPEETKGEFKTLPDYLEQAAGVHVIKVKGRGGYNVASIRGSTAAQVAIYVDGVLVNLGSESAVDLSTIPVENVERIEVYRGYVPAQFGVSGMGAVISIVTKKPEKGTGSLMVGAGSFGERHFSSNYSAPLGEGTLFMGLEAGRADGDFPYENRPVYGTPSLNYDTHRTNNGWENENVILKWNDDSWNTSVSWKNRDRDVAMPAANHDRDGAKIARTNQTTERWDASVGRKYEVGDLWWGWNVFHTCQDKLFRDPDGDFDPIVPGNHFTSYETAKSGLGLNASLSIGTRHFIEVFGEISREKLDIEEDYYEYQIHKDFKKYHYTVDYASVTLQDTITLNESQTLTAVPSLRWNEQNDEDHPSWSIALNWAPNEAWLVKGTFGRYYRAPNMYEKYGDGFGILRNEKLLWENGYHYDLGIHWHSDGERLKTKWGLTGFILDTENLIEFVQLNQRYCQYRNVGKAYIKGIELEAGLRWPEWRLDLAYTWMDPENRSAGPCEGQLLRNRPEDAWFARLNHDFNDRINGYVEGIFTGSNYFSTDGTVKYDDLLVFNGGLRCKNGKNGTLIFGVDDIFDEGPERMVVPAPGYNGHERMPYYPLQGRTFHFSYLVKF